MNHEQRALAKSVQKIQAVLDRYPEGVSLSDITGKTQLSSAAARAALKHMGAECEDGLWFEGASAVGMVEPEPEPVTIAESAPVEPVTIEPQPKLKKLTQAVFDGLPVEYRWAAVDQDGTLCAFTVEPIVSSHGQWVCKKSEMQSRFIDNGYDASDWHNSKIERDVKPEQTQTLAEAQAEIERLRAEVERLKANEKEGAIDYCRLVGIRDAEQVARIGLGRSLENCRDYLMGKSTLNLSEILQDIRLTMAASTSRLSEVYENFPHGENSDES